MASTKMYALVKTEYSNWGNHNIDILAIGTKEHCLSVMEDFYHTYSFKAPWNEVCRYNRWECVNYDGGYCTSFRLGPGRF